MTMEPWTAAKNALGQCGHQHLSGFIVNGHLPRVSCQSRLSANDKGDNEMTTGAVQRVIIFIFIIRETITTNRQIRVLFSLKNIKTSNYKKKQLHLLFQHLLTFTLQQRKIPKTSARRPPKKAVRPVIASNRVPYIQTRSVGSHGMSGRNEGNTIKTCDIRKTEETLGRVAGIMEQSFHLNRQ